MRNLGFLKDTIFLRELDNEANKFYWVKITVLNQNEGPVQSIEGRVLPGSVISVDGNSSVRRTCNITFLAEEANNDLTNIDNLLSINKKIEILVGIENHINPIYEDIIWFPQGVYVIVQPTITNNLNGCTIQLTCKDKMCLLNGECAGNLPTSITFHEYKQIIGFKDCRTQDPAEIIKNPNSYIVYKYEKVVWDERQQKFIGIPIYKRWAEIRGWYESSADDIGKEESIPQKFYDIIRTLVCNFGGEDLSKIFVSDIPLESKQLLRWVNSDGKKLWYNKERNEYAIEETVDWEPDMIFQNNDNIGYAYTDFTYPGELISNIGDNVCSILDKIKEKLGNYEYFYDINGNFIFQEIRNYLNNSYSPVDVFRLDNYRKEDPSSGRKVDVASNGLSILDGTNYEVDFNNTSKSAYIFEENTGLVSAYTNTPSYTNLKNDFHIWGKNNDKKAIHYHLVIKHKPILTNDNKYNVVFLKNEQGELTQKLRLATEDDDPSEIIEGYIPADWRAKLFLDGLEKQKIQMRPDIYEQELLDLFEDIYDFTIKLHPDDDDDHRYGAFKTDIVTCPNTLTYFFDYLEPYNKMTSCCVDALKTRVYSYQKDSINKMFDNEVPNVIIINGALDEETIDNMKEKYDRMGNQLYFVTDAAHNIYDYILENVWGYSAQEVGRELLYQYTNYSETITIQCIPIYYLEANTRITVYNQKAGISGDYIIKSISLPIDAGGTMTINAVRALERI